MRKNEIATQLIGELDDSIITDAKEKLTILIKKGLKPVFEYNESPVYHYGDSEKGSYCLTVDNEVVYFVRYKKIGHNGMRFGRQVLVWNDKNCVESVGFPSYLFFNFLLPKFGSLIADQEQTVRGQRFWMFAVKKAMDDGLFVYILDRRNRENTLTLITSYPQYRIASKGVWGTSDSFRRVFMVISQKPLQIVPKHLRKVSVVRD